MHLHWLALVHRMAIPLPASEGKRAHLHFLQENFCDLVSRDSKWKIL